MELITQTALVTPIKKLFFRISAAGADYSFEFATKPNNWTLLKDKVDGKFLSTQVAGGFIGCIFGMYATSSGSATSNHAAFSYLKYAGNDPMYNKTGL